MADRVHMPRGPKVAEPTRHCPKARRRAEGEFALVCRLGLWLKRLRPRPARSAHEQYQHRRQLRHREWRLRLFGSL